MLFQYYSILHVILSNTHFNILLYIGEYWFQYYLILPEQLGDELDGLCGLAPGRVWRRGGIGGKLESGDSDSPESPAPGAGITTEAVLST